MKNTIILTVHDKEKTIGRIVKNILTFTSDFTTNLIIVLDGCTDNTFTLINELLDNFTTPIKVQFVETNDVWETKANNVGLRLAKTEFVTIIQDDMLILQKKWDRKLFSIFLKNNLFSVSGRASLNFKFTNGQFYPAELYGREYPFGNVTIFGRAIGKIIAILKPYWIYKYLSRANFSLTANRGPLMIKRTFLERLNYFDEQFAPFELDDVDLCCRAFKSFGLRSASYPIYYEELSGSKATSFKSNEVSKRSIEKNSALLVSRHSDLAV
jgi:glycosyltransferase involved in cell wall biosynthesis